MTSTRKASLMPVLMNSFDSRNLIYTDADDMALFL